VEHELIILPRIRMRMLQEPNAEISDIRFDRRAIPIQDVPGVNVMEG